MDHDQDNEKRFVRRAWAATGGDLADTTSTLHLGVGGVLPDPDRGRGVGRGEGFRFNPECSCWRCAIDKLCKELERIEQLSPELTAGHPHWDGDLAQEIEAVRELEGEIEALQNMDSAARRFLFFGTDGYPNPGGGVPRRHPARRRANPDGDV